MTEHTPTKKPSRESLLLPVLIPVVALVAIVAALFLFSRVLLGVSHTAATATALVTAAGIMVVASIVVSRKQVSSSAMFSLFGGVLGIAMLAGGTALLLGQPEEEVEVPLLALVAPPGASVDGYATQALTAPAAVAFEIEFDNQEVGVQHNVDLADADPTAGGTVLAETAVITGPATTTYSYEPLDVGEYAFFCKIHPTTMKGTLTVAEGAEPGGGGTGGAGLAVVAKGIAFDTDTIELPADVPSQIAFDNQDAATPHNIAIFTDDTLAEPLFQGEIVTGPATVTYDVPPIAAGRYFFHCDVHPNMQGTVVVDGGEEPPPSESASPSETSSPEEPPGGGEVSAAISASNLLFDIDVLTFAADTPATLTFDNADPGIPHNVAIYTDDSAATSLFVGELITGPASVDYKIPGLPAGTYFFRCDVHPATMVGTVGVT